MFIKDESRIVIENNAMKCYDWILVSATVMGTLQIELVMDAVRFMITFLLRAKHF